MGPLHPTQPIGWRARKQTVALADFCSILLMNTRLVLEKLP